jgi:hypothetical protein
LFGRIVREEEKLFLLIPQQVYKAQCTLEQPITQVESTIHIQQKTTNSAQFLNTIHRENLDFIKLTASFVHAYRAAEDVRRSWKR